MKKITMATLKSFIRKNAGKLFVKNLSHFDSMTDCVEQCHDRQFREAQATDEHGDHSLGIRGVWCVRGSRDWFTAYNEKGFRGIEVYNCCGSFIIAVRA